MPQIDIKITSTADTSGLEKTREAAQRTQREITEGQNAVAASSRRNLQVMQAAGYQLQDFAVQISGGTSALKALGQQGSQFLSVFGPAGAIGGAVLAVGALAGQFMFVGKNADTAKKKAEDTFKTIGDLTDKLIAEKERNFLDSLAPEDRLKLARERIAVLTRDIEQSMIRQKDLEKLATSYDPKIHLNEAETKKKHDKALQDSKEEGAARLKMELEVQSLIKRISDDEKTVESQRNQRRQDVLADEERHTSDLITKQKQKNDEVAKERKQREDQAKQYRELGDEAAKYARQLEEIKHLEEEGTLSGPDAQAAKDKVHIDAAMVGIDAKLKIAKAEREAAGPTLAESNRVTPGQEAAAQAAADAAILAMSEDGVREAIRAAREEVEAYDIQLAELDRNPALSDAEKYQKRVGLLDAQTDAIGRLKKGLEDLAAAHPEMDVAALTTAIDRLSKQAAENVGKRQAPQTLAQRDDIAIRDLSDPSKHYQSAGDGIAGAMQQQVAQLGTDADQISRAFSQSAESIRTSMGDAFADVVLTSGSTSQRVNRFAQQIGISFIHTGAQMLADWIMKHTLMAAVSRIFHATDVALTAGAELTKTEVTVVGSGARMAATAKETAPSLAQAGIKAMSAVANIPYVGPILAIAALAAVIAAGTRAMKGFATGGVVDGGEQVVRINENGTEAVLNARATSMLGRAGIDALNAGNLVPALTPPGYEPAIGAAGAAGQPGANGGAQTLTIPQPIMVGSMAEARSIARGSPAETQILEIVHRDRYKIFGRRFT